LSFLLNSSSFLPPVFYLLSLYLMLYQMSTLLVQDFLK
jgi:hypothetical protein